MVFPTVSYSTKLTLKKSKQSSPSSTFTTSSVATPKKTKLGSSKIGPRSAPNRYDRIAAYDRAFQKCIRKDSKLASWKRRMDEKGLPNPLIEGYQRSSTSWQHSLSSLSSDSSSSSSSSLSITTNPASKDHTFNRAMKRFDIKPIRSITITSSSPSSSCSTTPHSPSSIVAPIPKPSVSRRIINRLSLSITNKNNSIKVAPTATQSLRRHSHQSDPSPHYYRCQYHYPSTISPPSVISPIPTPSLSSIHHSTQPYHYHNHYSHHPHQQQQQHTSRFLQRSLDRPLHRINIDTMKNSTCHYTNTITPPSPPSSPCSNNSIDEVLSLKRHIGTSSFSQYSHRQKLIAK